MPAPVPINSALMPSDVVAQPFFTFVRVRGVIHGQRDGAGNITLACSGPCQVYDCPCRGLGQCSRPGAHILETPNDRCMCPLSVERVNVRMNEAEELIENLEITRARLIREVDRLMHVPREERWRNRNLAERGRMDVAAAQGVPYVPLPGGDSDTEEESPMDVAVEEVAPRPMARDHTHYNGPDTFSSGSEEAGGEVAPGDLRSHYNGRETYSADSDEDLEGPQQQGDTDPISVVSLGELHASTSAGQEAQRSPAAASPGGGPANP